MVRAGGFAADVVGTAVDQLLLLEGEVVAVGAVSPKGWWEGEVVDGPAPKKTTGFQRQHKEALTWDREVQLHNGHACHRYTSTKIIIPLSNSMQGRCLYGLRYHLAMAIPILVIKCIIVLFLDWYRAFSASG
jgi:hypothetical protein